MSTIAIQPAAAADRAAILRLADRLASFGPTSRSAAEIGNRERRALADAIERLAPDSALLVARHPALGLVGVLLLESRRDYFTDVVHGHVSTLAVAQEAEGQGVGRALLAAAEAWGRERGYPRLTLAVFTENLRARELYGRQGWRSELETYYKPLEEPGHP
jgi:GNAT superfamily N-acetyltransferase